MEEKRFIFDTELFNWFIKLNIRLSKLKKFKINKNTINSIFNSLGDNAKHSSLPTEAIEWGSKYGLISKDYGSEFYVFPLAKILSFLSIKDYEILLDISSEFCEKRIWRKSFKKVERFFIKNLFLHFKKREIFIIKAREGFKRGIFTLQRIGSRLGISRERVRQLEKKFWFKIKKENKYRRDYLAAFLCDFFRKSGSLLLEDERIDAYLRKFLIKGTSIPLYKIKELGITFIAFSSLEKKLVEDKLAIKSKKLSINNLKKEDIKGEFEKLDDFVYILEDKEVFFEKLVKNLIGQLKNEDRALITMTEIGRPAHYSKIAEIHNCLFPEYKMKEKRMLSTLVNNNNGEIVWIGLDGVYALRKWGYEKPTKTLYEIIFEIVSKKHKETEAPVPMTVIRAEIGKHRKIVNPNSLACGAYFNPNLKKVGKNSFVPKSKKDQEETITEKKLDEILEDFKQNLGIGKTL